MALIDLAAWLLALSVLYAVQLGIRRLYFSPISHIPGPKVAALTWLYEFYWDIITMGGGRYTFQIIELHEKYGPIMRINPDEVHISDPDFYWDLYSGGGRLRHRTKFFVKQFGAPESVAGTMDHDLHKLRRAALNPFFSTQSVRKLQPVMEERVNALLARLHEYSKTSKEPLNLIYPLSAFTNDIINEYAFARSQHMTEDPTWGKSVTDSLLKGTHYGKWIQHIEIILKIVNALPEFISARYVPGWSGFLQMKKDIRAQIAEIKATENTAKWQLDVSHPTVFHEMLSSKVLPPHEKSVSRLGQDGQILVQAGTLTSSWTLAIAVFHIVNDPAVATQLRDELFAHIPDPNAVVALAKLETLPYLRAVVMESLRWGVGGSGRLPRVAPDETLEYLDKRTGQRWKIPAGVAVSMTTYQTLTAESIYPEPFGFRPDRWLGDAEKRLERYFNVFGGGTKMCLGKALAQAEIFLVLAKLFRVWGTGGIAGVTETGDRRPGDVGIIRMYETTARDCEMAHDFFIPIPFRGSKGIRIVLEPA